jgi:hypothetical protein
MLFPLKWAHLKVIFYKKILIKKIPEMKIILNSIVFAFLV